jgi:hypothetical protein
MRVLRFQIRYPTGQTEQINIEHERALIGSGAHCDIRLPIDQAAVEHVLIEVGAGGNVFAKALSFEPPPTMNNIPFTQAPLPAETLLGVGQVQIYAQAADIAGGVIQTQQKKQGASPITIIAVLLMIPAAGYLFFVDPPQDTVSTKPPKEPELWGAPVASCPQPNGEQALALAREKRSVADAKRERRPFHVQDGVAAVPLYELAAVCFRAGGDAEASSQAYAAANALRKELTDDYRTQRVRLEHALSVQDGKTAQRQVKVLMAFTEGKPGDYVTWLSNLDRRLKIKLGSGGPPKS